MFGDRRARARDAEDAGAPAGIDPLAGRSVWSVAREALTGGSLVKSRSSPAPPGRAARLGLTAVDASSSRVLELPFQLFVAGDEREVSMELTGERDGASLGVFDLFIGYQVGSRGESVGGSNTLRYHVGLVSLDVRGLPWLAITDRRPPIELYDRRTRRRLETGDRKLDRGHCVHSEDPDAVRVVFASAAARDWLTEALTERYVDHRPIAVVEITDGWALIAARAGDFGHPDELALANPRLRFGPWPDEVLRRLVDLRGLSATAGPG